MTLGEASGQYIAKRQASGCAFDSGRKTLQAFSRFTGDIPLCQVHPDHVLCYLNKTITSNITWRTKYWTIRRFFEHFVHRGIVSGFIMPLAKPNVRQTFIPYIYTQSEIRLLLEACKSDQRSILSISPLCSSAMLVFLYATGACIGEASRILLSDLDLEGYSITLKNARSRRHRTVPLGGDVVEYLRPYVAWRSEINCANQALFVTKSGVTVSTQRFGNAFGIFRRIADLHRRDGTDRKPRAEDLRHTFAVHRIDKWIREGADLNRMLPALAAYMGQNGLGATNRYLFMTPERFRKDLDKLSPLGGHGGWCEDRKLMSVLSEL
jgi:integrase/recombinase XerD